MTNTYKLLTPGPLTTTDTVKQEMMVDRCTWDDDYKAVTQKIRRQLLELAQVSEDDYTAVLMQGSGTFGVESVFSSVIGDQDKVLICSNGAYGERMTQICDHAKIPYLHYAQTYDKVPDASHIAKLLAEDTSITHVAMVHSETTSGILNDIESVGRVVRQAGRTFIVDAMSSFGGVDIPAGIYLLAQYNAYNTASGAAKLATGETASNVKAVLKAECTGTINGEEVTTDGADYVARLTLRSLQYYAAVEKKFGRCRYRRSRQDRRYPVGE